MTTTESVSLYTLIRQVLDETNLNDPREIAAQVVDRITAEQAREYLVNILASEVRSALMERRNRALANVSTPAVSTPSTAPSHPRPRPTPPPPVTGGSIQAEQAPRPNRSAKRDGIRDWWAEMLRSSLHVGAGRWKPLGECGEKELEFAELERRRKAEEQTGYAKKYFALRLLLGKYQVETVAELPENAARQAMS